MSPKKDMYTAQILNAGFGRNGHTRAGVLICQINDWGPRIEAQLEQWIEDFNGWQDIFKRYPQNQVIRLPDVRVPFSEIRLYRRWQKARDAQCA